MIWSDWFPDLTPSLPGCPEPQMIWEMRRAAQVFFGNTRAWKITTDPISVAAGDKTVTIDPGPGLDLSTIEMVWYDGRELDMKTLGDMDYRYFDAWMNHTGTMPIDWFQASPSQVGIRPFPSIPSTTGLVARCAVKPDDKAKGIPDELATNFREELLMGARARLMLIPNQPWSNPTEGAAMLGQFGAMLDKARVSVAKNFGRAKLRTRVSLF